MRDARTLRRRSSAMGESRDHRATQQATGAHAAPRLEGARVIPLRGRGLRVAAIDVGSNSIRLVVAEADVSAGYRILDEEREMTRLAEGVDATGRLSPAAVDRSVAAVRKLKAIAEGFEVTRLRTVATSAVRDAKNGAAFCRRLNREAGVSVEVLAPEAEAALAFRSAAHHFPVTDRHVAIVDLGGGSVEIILAAGGVVERTVSLPLGAVRLTGRFWRSDPWRKRHLRELTDHVQTALDDALGGPLVRPEVLIGSGGTFTALAQIVRQERDRRGGSVHGYALTASEIQAELRRLAAIPVDRLRTLAGLPPERADIIVAGVATIAAIATHLDARSILVNGHGIRDAMVQSLLGLDRPPTNLPPPSRLESARTFARRCRSHERHCEHVAALALALFDGTRRQHRLLPPARELLETAALLHDVGYLVGPTKTHKHGYHLIVHSALSGYSTRELEVVANIVRYHRGAEPRGRHENLKGLSAEARREITILAALLRVADGLDRTHTSALEVRSVRTTRGAVHLALVALQEPETDLYYAGRRRHLFETVFEKRLRLSVARSRTRRGAAAGRGGPPPLAARGRP